MGEPFARQGEPPDLEPGGFEQEPSRRTQEAEARPAPGGHERQDDRKEPSQSHGTSSWAVSGRFAGGDPGGVSEERPFRPSDGC